MPLSYVQLFVLRAIATGHRFGFDIMDATSLPSGTVYPALRRLEAQGLVASSWESDQAAQRGARPRRRNYALTPAGRAALTEGEAKYHAVSKLFAKRVRP
jgi:DNA-binding PadR family transcriptional regulator